jgi:hypothetical protein
MGRRQAEALMVSSCVISRMSGRSLNEQTGEYSDTFTVVYDGRCEFKYSQASFEDVDAASQQLTQQRPVLKVPVEGTAGVMVGDVVELTGHPLDTGMVGLQFRIAGLHSRTYATARRFPVEVTTGV